MPSTNYTIKKQEFLNSVVNKIGRQIYSTTAYTNPLKRIKKGFIENTIKDFKRSYNSAYKELRKLGYDDEDIAYSMKSLIEENDYSNSDQLIDDVAKKYDVYDKLLEKAFHASQF